MATTTITVASFEDACAECADAIADEDRKLAYKWYARAEAINAGLAVQAGQGGDYLRRHESLQGLNKALAAAFGAITAGAEDTRFLTARTNFKK